MLYTLFLYSEVVFCTDLNYRVKLKDDYKEYPLNDKLYKYSNLLFYRKTIELKDYDRENFEFVRELASNENSKNEIVLNELPSILKLIKQLGFRDEKIFNILKNLYGKIFQKSNMDFLLEKGDAIMLLKGFAEYNNLSLQVKDTLAVLNLPKRMTMFPLLLDETRKFFLYGKTCDRFLKLDTKNLQLFFKLFKMAEFKELHFKDYFLTENLVNKMYLLQDVTHLNIFTEKDKTKVKSTLSCLRSERENVVETFFENIGSLKNLKRLKIEYTCNKVKLYENLIGKNLIELDIETDEFSEDNLRSIFRLNSLEILRLNGKFPTNVVGYFKTFDTLNNLQSLTIENAGEALLKQLTFLDFFPIPNIKKLILPKVQLSKGFSDYFQYFEKLIELDLSYVNISNNDLNKIYELENLKKLTLVGIQNDNLLKMNSKQLKLSSLEELDISGNSLEYEDIIMLSALPNLKILKARSLRNFNIIFFDIGHFKKLTSLDLRGNNLTFKSYPGISGYKMMKSLFIDYSTSSNLKGPDFLNYFLKFTYKEFSIDNLDMNDLPLNFFSNWKFNGKLILANPIGLENGLKDLINIESLTISNGSFDDKPELNHKKADLREYNLSDIGALKNLRSLSFNGLNLKKKYMEEISKLGDIRILKFYFCDFNLFDLSFLKNFKKLEHVIIYKCYGFDNEKEIINKLPKVWVEISN